MTRPRITGPEFAEVVAWLTARWPDTRTWRQPVEDLYADFRYAVTAGALQEAATAWFDEGHDRAPSPSVLKARAVQAMRAMPADPARCPHRSYGIDDVGNGWVELTCANPVCRFTWTGRADQYRTVGDRT